MAVAKWFLKLSSRTPPLDAARTVLEARARGVSHYLHGLAKRRHEHPEQIHQLRVSTRRLGAALRIFREFLQPDDFRALRQLTRRIRRAAGDARDIDVQRELIGKRLRRPNGSTLASGCEAALKTRRLTAYGVLIKITRDASVEFNKLVHRSFARLTEPAAVRKRYRQTLANMAEDSLRRRSKQMRAAARKDLSDLDNLHQLRIAAKRLRYAMEVFAGCFPVQFRRREYRVVERIQEELGRVNDLRNLRLTLKQLPMWLEATGPVSVETRDAIEKLRQRLKLELTTAQGRFIRRWNANAQRAFHRTIKEVVSKPVARSRIRGRGLTEL